MRRYKILVTMLALGCLALGAWVLQLRRNLDRAEYYAESGVVSVLRICSAAASYFPHRTELSPELHTFASVCLGVHDDIGETKRINAELRNHDLDAIARRLETMFLERRLPHLSVEPRGTRLPKQYVEGDPPLIE